MKLKNLNRKDLNRILEFMYKKDHVKYLGFVAKEGSSAGLPLIYYPLVPEKQQELCGKIVGILREISDLKISFLEHFSEIILHNFKEYVYLIEIDAPIFFYCVIEKKSNLRRVQRRLRRNIVFLQEIFKKSS